MKYRFWQKEILLHSAKPVDKQKNILRLFIDVQTKTKRGR